MNCFLLFFVITVVFFFLAVTFQRPSIDKENVILILTFGAVEFLGYYIRSVAAIGDMYILGTKLFFFADCFISYAFFLYFINFCKVNVRKWLNFALFALAAVVAIGVSTFDKHTLMYKSFDVVTTNGSMIIDFEPGILFYIFSYLPSVFLICYFVILFIAHKKEFSLKRKKQVQILFLIPTFSLIAYFISLFVDMAVANYINATSLFAGIVTLFLLSMFGDIYDSANIVEQEAYKGLDSALIVFTSDGKYKGANPFARTMFPSLANLATSDKIPSACADVLSSLLSGETTEYSWDGKTYESIVRDTEGGCKALWLYDVTSARENVAILENYQKDLENEVEAKTKHIKNLQEQVMMSMADIIEGRDNNTGGHVKRTSAIVKVLADAMLRDNYPGANEQLLHAVITTAPLHDLGKITIPDSILLKPGKFTDEEFEIMKSHSERGADLVVTVLDGVETPAIIHVTESIARSHHEKWNGTGYPEKLAGEDIPLAARIMAIADVYDALVSKRCYKDAMTFEKANSIMEESFGSHFDPSLKKYFDECLPTIESFYSQ